MWSKTMTSKHRLLSLAFFGVTCTLGDTPKLGWADAPPGRYTIANGTVYDTKTKLTWEQTPGPNSFYPTLVPSDQYCPTLMLEGGGWRLPSLTELLTIVDESRSDPAIDPTAFPATPSEPFVAPVKSKLADGESECVYFKTGEICTGSGLIRCVR